MIRFLSFICTVLFFTLFFYVQGFSGGEPSKPPSTGRMFVDYKPKLSEDTILDYMPALADDFGQLPPDTPQHLEQLLSLFSRYHSAALESPGSYVKGNMILGANENQYEPSVPELMLMETGDRIRFILMKSDNPKLYHTVTRHLPAKNAGTYKQFSFYHVDVMGSGRFFYVDQIKMINLLPQQKAD